MDVRNNVCNSSPYRMLAGKTNISAGLLIFNKNPARLQGGKKANLLPHYTSRITKISTLGKTIFILIKPNKKSCACTSLRRDK